MSERPRVTPILRGAGPPAPPRRRKLTAAQAAQLGERELLGALLNRIAVVIDTASPRDLAALSRRVVTIRHDLADLDGPLLMRRSGPRRRTRRRGIRTRCEPRPRLRGVLRGVGRRRGPLRGLRASV
jgi:hypothetical protein